MTKKRKSIVSSFGNFATRDAEDAISKSATHASEPKKPSGRVGAGIVGATRRTLTDLREERDSLLASVKDGEVVLTIDPNLIDPSPFTDRLPDDGLEDFEEFKLLLAEEGQIVPITIRRHPEDSSRYQTVYGHRRCKALRELGQDAKAIVRDYSDRELAVAQGIENASRQNLSWIEKALFVATMESAGLKPKDIKSALSVDDAQISKFRQVYRALGDELIQLIGRAPKIGRPRWLDLVHLVQNKADRAALKKTLSSDKVLALSSDDRFLMAVSSLTSRSAGSSSRVKKLGDVGEVRFGERSIGFSLKIDQAASFSAFMEGEMESLLERFKQTTKNKE